MWPSAVVKRSCVASWLAGPPLRAVLAVAAFLTSCSGSWLGVCHGQPCRRQHPDQPVSPLAGRRGRGGRPRRQIDRASGHPAVLSARPPHHPTARSRSHAPPGKLRTQWGWSVRVTSARHAPRATQLGGTPASPPFDVPFYAALLAPGGRELAPPLLSVDATVRGRVDACGLASESGDEHHAVRSAPPGRITAVELS